MAGVRPRLLLFLLLLPLLPSLLSRLLILLLFLPASAAWSLRFTCLLLHHTITPKILTLLPALINFRNRSYVKEVDSLDKSSPTRFFRNYRLECVSTSIRVF